MKRVLLSLLLLGLASGPATAVIDPFYRNRMDSGVRAFEQGNWQEAARQLRIACFGHLDEPRLLAAGLIRLAIAEARHGDEEGFRRAFSRLVELEERFAAYSSVAVAPELRQQFQTLASQLVPKETLRSASGFAPVARQAEMERISGLSPDRRRAELQALIEAEPGRSDLTVEMARLELAERRPQAALAWLDRLPAEVAQLPPASCLRQQAATETKSCQGMDLVQPFCGGVPPEVVDFRLQCLVDAGRWAEAASLLADLDPGLRARRRVARLEQRVRKNFDGSAPSGTTVNAPPANSTLVPEAAGAAAGEAPPASAPSESTAAVEPTPAPQNPAPAAADLEEVARLRRSLEAATTADELAALRGTAEALADRRPDLRQARLLTAEIAYLQSDWAAAAAQFEQVGRLRPDGEAHLAFYHAVALYETGDRSAAAAVLRPVAERLERNGFVDAYVRRILAPGG